MFELNTQKERVAMEFRDQCKAILAQVTTEEQSEELQTMNNVEKAEKRGRKLNSTKVDMVHRNNPLNIEATI